ncbi:hypothetical protein [Pseudomarimonas arenosa]|uniref:DUF3185 domain-containing protein n=1 Tax=Pseudomarimonas arenosa TaxID=2774145 RepID=A0AAW3ZNB3_9GAMM|nr:hypothetical protein [Pseudomarimonas arenosa]MBD8527443.1 hypothetical protein [Pseudomarimonas arenosa]
MKATRIAGIVLLVAGALGLAYGGFTYTKDTHSTKLGPIELSVKDKETITVPLWLSIAGLISGGLLILLPGKR